MITPYYFIRGKNEEAARREREVSEPGAE